MTSHCVLHLFEIEPFVTRYYKSLPTPSYFTFQDGPRSDLGLCRRVDPKVQYAVQFFSPSQKPSMVVFFSSKIAQLCSDINIVNLMGPRDK